jgi:dephospho-CoA kinase
MKLLIGITGGIGTGKSSVSNLLAAYCNRPLINIDAMCRQLLQKNASGWLALQQKYGDKFFADTGDLDRPLLREHIFSNSLLREDIDALLHPIVRKTMQLEVEQLHQNLVFVEIPLLYEAGWEDDVQKVIVVATSAETQYARIMKRDGVEREQAVAAVAAQMPLEQKRDRADFVVDNSGSWHLTRDIVIDIACQLEKAGFS